MQTAITNPEDYQVMPMLNAYRYDQLNRLVESRSFETDLNDNLWNPMGYDKRYFNEFTYDANGNILRQRRLTRNATQIDELNYQYQYDSNEKLARNRLYHVNDAIAPGVDSTDIDDMGVFYDDPNVINVNNNYVYDLQGRLIKDVQEEIDTIIWTNGNKVKEIRRTLGSVKTNLYFDYERKH